VKLHSFFVLLFSIALPFTRSTYSVGDTITFQDQSLEYNVCHSDDHYGVGDSFSLSNYNGDLNGGNYKIFLISMNATW